MSMQMLNAMNRRPCPCGKCHSYDTKIFTGKGVLSQLPQIVGSFGAKRAFLLSDRNTWSAAGEAVSQILTNAGIPFTSYCSPCSQPEPDESSVGSAVMHFDAKCDILIGIGSGVINDIGKILSHLTGNPYIIVGTAPSMDGYASATSSMTRSGLKVSLPTRSADIIIGDADILCQAPLKMMQSGLGDMLAKYVSICEWRISHLVTGEYYCEQVADLIRTALKQCVEHAPGLLQRDEQAVMAVFEGLVIGGVAMNYAGLSRPASGVEHYISHVLDMRGVEFGTPVDLHGIQCAIGTLIALRLYEKLKSIPPDREKALAYGKHFDLPAWHRELRTYLGKSADSMIALEAKEQKYAPALQEKRLDTLLLHWEEILDIITQELPSSVALEALLDTIQAPKSLEDIGISGSELPVIFKATKDIRDKYVLSRLAWDLGIIEDLLS